MKLSTLFLAPLLAGISVYMTPRLSPMAFRPLLAFGASYLFSITAVHIAGPLRQGTAQLLWTVLAAACGFVLQRLLARGLLPAIKNGAARVWSTPPSEALSLLLVLCLHAFVEGCAAAQMIAQSEQKANAVLFGIALHHAPAAFTGMTAFLAQTQSHRRALLYLTAFSLAAPAGLLVGRWLADGVSEQVALPLYALMAGSFLYVALRASWITQDEGRLPLRGVIATLLGVLLAVAMELAS